MEPLLCRLDTFHLSHYGGLSNVFSAASSCGPTYCELWACRGCYWAFVHFAMLNVHSCCFSNFLDKKADWARMMWDCPLLRGRPPHFIIVNHSIDLTPQLTRSYNHTHTVPHNNLKPNSITLSGSKLVADRFEAKFHYAIWFEPVSNQLRTS